MCEKQGYIERYYVESPKDKVDLTIKDMQLYTRTLIEEETSLPTMVEKALREIEKEDAENAESEDGDIVDDIDLNFEDMEKELKDDDFNDFSDFLDEDASLNEEV